MNDAEMEARMAAKRAAVELEQAEAQDRLGSALISVDDVLNAEVAPVRLAPIPHIDLLQPGYTLVTGEAGAGKTTFMLWVAKHTKMPVVHIDLEMGIAGLKQTYTDLRIQPRADWHVVTKEAFYDVPPLIGVDVDVLQLIDRAAPAGGALVLLDGWNEYASRFDIDTIDGNSVRRAISMFSTHAKTRNNSFCSFEHLSKEAIKDGTLHAKDSIEKTNAADGSLFVKVITPYSHTDVGGIRVGVGAKKLRGGFGSIEPRYFLAGGQGEHNQLEYGPCEPTDIPEADSTVKAAVLAYLQAYAPDEDAKRDKREICLGAGVTEYEAAPILDRLRAIDAVGCDSTRQTYKFWYKVESERGPKI